MNRNNEADKARKIAIENQLKTEVQELKDQLKEMESEEAHKGYLEGFWEWLWGIAK